MRKTGLTLTLLTTALLCALRADPAAAQRAFVAAQGSDGNPCTFATPCRTFQHAHDVVAAGGEIDVLDPAGYGMLIINKAISIQGHGFAGIGVGSGGTGITVNAGATDVVALNGLLIEGNGVGNNGIRVNTGSDLTIENCVIRGMTGTGIEYEPTTTPAGLAVSRTFIAGGVGGIVINPIGTTVDIKATLNRVELHKIAVIGVQLNAGQTTGGTINVSVVDSVAGNSSTGGNGAFSVLASAGQATSTLLLLRSLAANSGAAIQASGAAATVRIAQSALTENAVAVSSSNSAVVTSYGDNYIDGNGALGGPLTPISRQ
jgi:hypothetical protein